MWFKTKQKMAKTKNYEKNGVGHDLQLIYYIKSCLTPFLLCTGPISRPISIEIGKLSFPHCSSIFAIRLRFSDYKPTKISSGLHLSLQLSKRLKSFTSLTSDA
jgi:hypothetical protein